METLGPLLPIGAFSEIINRLTGKRWYYWRGSRQSDPVLEAGTQAFIKASGIDILPYSKAPVRIDPTTEGILCSGGGNIGIWRTSEEREIIIKRSIIESIPVIILPQSAFKKVDFPNNVTLFARERYTQAMYPGSLLAPDLSLLTTVEKPVDVENKIDGILLRRDQEGRFVGSGNDDPGLHKKLEHYVAKLNVYKTIKTDRLHCAILGLILGRQVTLLPNSYHKNIGVYEYSLKDLGCAFYDTV